MFDNIFNRKGESAGSDAQDGGYDESADVEGSSTEDAGTEVMISENLSLNRDLTSYDQSALDQLGISADAMERYKGLLSGGEGADEAGVYQEVLALAGDMVKNLSPTPGEEQIDTATTLLFGPSTSEDTLNTFKTDLTQAIGSPE